MVPALYADRGKCEPRFLIFSSEKNMYSIRAICQSNQLNESHHYVISNERSTVAGHNLLQKENFGGFTHVVYDSSVFSYSAISLFTIPKSGGKAFVRYYNPKSRVLVTPERNYV